MILSAWAKRHAIAPEAIRELRQLMISADHTPPADPRITSEAAVQNKVRLAAAERSGRLWRNNVGAGKLENGSFIRWGLCNDSAGVNAIVKSADLIGILPVEITAEHVGETIGQFWSVECKRPGWRYSGTERERAQLHWAESIIALGGKASFSTGELS